VGSRPLPEAEYADVYDRYGLLGDRTVLAHGVYLNEEELELLARRGTRIAHCPNSNLFLGAAFFVCNHTLQAGVTWASARTIGAGTNAVDVTTMADAYKVQQVQGVSLTPFHLWYLASLGGARALSLDGSAAASRPANRLTFSHSISNRRRWWPCAASGPRRLRISWPA